MRMRYPHYTMRGIHLKGIIKDSKSFHRIGLFPINCVLCLVCTKSLPFHGDTNASSIIGIILAFF